MIDRILEFSLRQRAFVLLALSRCSARASGRRCICRSTPCRTSPGPGADQHRSPGARAEESEKLVTLRIESEMAGLPGVEEMRSLTKFGLSQVTLHSRTARTFTARASSSPSGCKVCWNSLPPGACPSSRPSAPAWARFFTTTSSIAPTRRTSRRPSWSN